MSALTPSQQKEIKTTWAGLATNKVWVVEGYYPDTKESHIFVEGPFEHMESLVPDTDEVLLRVFTKQADAHRFCGGVQPYNEDVQVGVASYSLERLWEVIGKDLEVITEAFEAPLSVNLCVMPKDSHPKTVDVLFTSYATEH